MKRLRAVLFVGLILMIPRIAPCQTAGGSISEQQDYSFAVGLYRDGQYPLALQQFKAFLKNHPGSQRVGEVTFLAGECLLQEKMYDSALSYYQEVSEKFPGSGYFIRAQLRTGEIYLQLQKYERAEPLLKKVLSHSNDKDVKGEASYKLGQLFAAREDYNNAIKYFDLSYQGYPSSQFADYAMYGTAWCYGKLSNFGKSREIFQSLLNNYPETKLKADAVEKIGECDFFSDNYKAAVDEFAKALAQSTEDQINEPALYYEGRAYISLGLPDSARSAFAEYLREFSSSEHSNEVRVLYAKILIASGSDIPAALNLLNEIKPDDRMYFDSQVEVARAYETLGSKDTAESTLLQLARSSQNGNQSALAYQELGKVYFQNKSYNRSQEAFLLAAKDADLYAEAMKNAAVAAAAGNDFANAKLYFLNAISRLKGPSSLNAHLDYAAALYAAGDYQGAAQIYTTAIEIAPTDSVKSQSLYMAAESFYRGGIYSQAMSDYQKYLASYPDGVHCETALLGVGYSQYFSNDFMKAVQTFQNFIARYPASSMLSDAYLRMGDCYYYDKDYQKALNVYQDAAGRFATDTSSAYAWYQVGQSNFRLGNMQQALDAFRSAIQKFPSSSVAPEAEYAIGWVYFSQKDYPDAIANFSKVAVDYPKSQVAPRALYSKGDSYYNSGNYESALASYKQLLEEYPASQYVDNAIVGMQYCLTVLGRTREAEDVIDTFVKDHPNLPDVDRIYYKKVEYALNQKHYSEADANLREFLAKFPASPLAPQALYNLAVVETKLGREREAVGSLTKLIAQVPFSEFTTAGQVKLAEIYTRRREYSGAEKLLTEASAASNDYSTTAQVDLGKLYLLQGDTLQAESSFSKAALSQTDSTNDDQKADAKVLLSQIYFRRGRVPEALSLANSVAKTRDDLTGAEAQLHVAEYYCASGDSSNAVLAFLRVKYVFPSFTDIVAKSQLELADCLIKFGNFNDARTLLQQFLKGRTSDAFTREAREKLNRMKSR